MESNSLMILINEALQSHFKRISKYKREFSTINKINRYNYIKSLENKKIKKLIDFTVIKFKNPIIKFIDMDKSYETEVFGIYVNKYNTFSWSWALPSHFYGSSVLSKKLFDFYYDKDIETKYDVVNFFLRNIFITSRLQVKNKEEIDMIISLSEYVLKETNNFKFIFPHKKLLSDNPEDYIIIYYFAKKIIYT